MEVEGSLESNFREVSPLDGGGIEIIELVDDHELMADLKKAFGKVRAYETSPTCEHNPGHGSPRLDGLVRLLAV
jgi:hypothetical protein